MVTFPLAFPGLGQEVEYMLRFRFVMTVLLRPLLQYLLLISLMMSPAVSSQPELTSDSAWRLVNYWSEWCSPCRKEIPMLNALSSELDPSTVLVLGVNFDDDPRPETLEIAKRLGILFATLTHEETAGLGLRAPNAMPTTYLVAPSDDVVATLVGLQSRKSVLTLLSKHGLVTDVAHSD